MTKKALDTSDELIIYRFGSGIKLQRPDHPDVDYFLCEHNTKHSLQNLLALPFSVYLENTEMITQNCNGIAAIHCGFSSREESIGNPWYKLFKSTSIKPSVENNNEVMKKHQYKIVEEHANLNDDKPLHTLSIKMPWYSNENKVIGLFGCTIVLGNQPLADSLLQLTKLNLLSSSSFPHLPIGAEINSVYLSKREMECLALTIKRKTAKQIGQQLKLSSRTVEEYLNNIRNKMGANSKVELIEMVINHIQKKNNDA
ncbi:helix-turn-helix transcriptional regulator [Legionella sp. PATHC038]|uniref:helix-turn-helix transcriptional regulator n=1 Tax=Legionella sheltonii TaxID=2992041 RepID=UPI0022439923|nr:helix-turn-helix transcriptional regulator [Legionella sp. PATHC038]MCW8400887.1 helix-turn-helix transcriptional regulator [Legionella sp. PATHC038]